MEGTHDGFHLDASGWQVSSAPTRSLQKSKGGESAGFGMRNAGVTSCWSQIKQAEAAGHIF